MVGDCNQLQGTASEGLLKSEHCIASAHWNCMFAFGKEDGAVTVGSRSNRSNKYHNSLDVWLC